MPYIGNTIRAADDYRLIDDISSGFNGSTTSFALQVAGSTPVPFPKSPQQVLISVNGVIQEPDPTGASGFNLVGTNIVFSSAPTNGHAFFGIIYATADYLNAGGNFPAGSLGAPSITFIGDENTGLFRKSGGSVGFVSDATEIANFDSNGITISSGSLVIVDSIIHSGDPNTKIRFSDTDEISLETDGVQRLKVDGTEVVFNETGADVDFRVEGDTAANLLKVDASADKVGIGVASPIEILHANGAIISVASSSTSGTTGAKRALLDLSGNQCRLGHFRGGVSAGSGSLGLYTESTEKVRIDSDGDVLVGLTTALSTQSGSIQAAGPIIAKSYINAHTSNATVIEYISNVSKIRAYGATSGSGILAFNTGGGGDAADSEAMRIDVNGNVGIGTTSPASNNKLHLRLADSSIATPSTASVLLAENSGNSWITIGSGASSYGGILFGDSGASDIGQVRYNHNGNNLEFHTSSGERMRIDSSGNVRITSQHLRFDTTGKGIIFGIEGGSNRPSIVGNYTSSTNNNIAFNTTGSERMRIDSSGNVGIGTTNPSQKLDVSGGIKATTDITLASTTTGQSIIVTKDGTQAVKLGHIGTGNEGILVLKDGGTDTVKLNGETGGTSYINSGNVGIGTTSPSRKLDVVGDAEFIHDNGITIEAASTSTAGLLTIIGVNASDQVSAITRIKSISTGSSTAATATAFENRNSSNAMNEHMRITSTGNVGIGTTSPAYTLELEGSGGGEGVSLGIQNTGSAPAGINLLSGHGNWSVYNSKTVGDALEIRDETANSTRMIINSSGDVGIGTTSPTTGLHVNGTARVNQLLVNSSGVHNSARITVVGHTTGSHSNIQCQNSDGTQLFLVRNDNHTFVGTLSKSAGSFFIDHPLPSLAATKTLRHSFIEGPQCDNIYRGKVTLSSGTASINLDTVSKMTEGTFVVLNRDVQCFTTNETGFDSVKGSVENNILTIVCENNSSTDTISWMVVGERQDPGIKTAGITDDEGYLLVEEDKVVG